MDIKAFFLYTITVIGCFIFLNYKRDINKCVSKSMEKIGNLCLPNRYAIVCLWHT